MSHIESPVGLLSVAPRADRLGGIVYPVIGCASLLLWWLCRSHVALLPGYAPWDFSFIEFLTSWIVAWWYLRGLALTPSAERPATARQIAFFAGLFVVYAVLETHFEYFAEHQFFYNRMQHAALHHVGPFLLALSWPGAVLARGAPKTLLRVAGCRTVTATLQVLQQPFLAATIFVGLIFFWLIPAIHFHAMIDPRLFCIMNWSMVLDGFLFWFLVLDPRPSPPARISVVARMVLAAAVIIPQVMGGALITLARTDLYPYYELCGRIYPAIGPLGDQTIGGAIVWIMGAMMSGLAVSVIIARLLRTAEATAIYLPAQQAHNSPPSTIAAQSRSVPTT